MTRTGESKRAEAHVLSITRRPRLVIKKKKKKDIPATTQLHWCVQWGTSLTLPRRGPTEKNDSYSEEPNGCSAYRAACLRMLCLYPASPGFCLQCKVDSDPPPMPLSVEYSLVENDDWDSRVTLDKALNITLDPSFSVRWKQSFPCYFWLPWPSPLANSTWE